MELNGKCKKAFEKWFNHVQKYNIDWFYRLNLEYQYGVYVDFFDSVGIIIELSNTDGWMFTVDFDGLDSYNTDWDFNSRQEARTKAIEKANEIFNNQN